MIFCHACIYCQSILSYCKSCNLRGELWACKSRPSGFSYHSLGNASSYSHRADNLLASPISQLPSGLGSNPLQLRGLSARRDEGKAETAAWGLTRSRHQPEQAAEHLHEHSLVNGLAACTRLLRVPRIYTTINTGTASLTEK